MRIGALSQATGLPASKVRYYESLGLLPVVERQANGYRHYPPQAVQLLTVIDLAQRAGFTLEEIRSLMPRPGRRSWDRPRLLERLRRKQADIQAMQARLRQSERDLGTLIKALESEPQGEDCLAKVDALLGRLGQPAPAGPRLRAA